VLAALRGSICLYQGEELGLPEAELAFEDLRDPYGIRFWPGFKGRDGCRTPMVWEEHVEHAGFSTGKPWLPIPPQHRVRAMDAQADDQRSVLARYKAALSFRRNHPALVSGSIRFLDAGGDVLAFIRDAGGREGGGEKLLCLFNFADEPAVWRLPEQVGAVTALDFPGDAGSLQDDAVSLPPLGIFLGKPVG